MDKNKIVLLWNEGKTFSEIAAELGGTRSAVAGQISRLRAKGEARLLDERPQCQKPVRQEKMARPYVRRGRPPIPINPRAAAIRASAAERREARLAKIRMDHVEHKPIENIADKVVKPGIDKHLVPLCLYMGTRSFGRIHRWWNFTLAAMEQGCDDLTDIVKLSHHPDYSHLCGPAAKIQHMSAQGFFSRLRDNPKVTDNVPGLTEWAEHVLPNPFQFRRVPLESFEKNCAPWRVFKIRRKAFRGNVKPVAASACYPFIAHDPKKEGFDLVSKVNKAVPKGLPEEIRADICQDIICAILAGEMSEADLQGGVKDFIAAGRKMFANKWEFLSLDAEVPGMEGKTYMDGLAGDVNEGWELA